MASSKEMTLTSVKVKADLFENFKIECVKRKFSFQKQSKFAVATKFDELRYHGH